MKILIFIVTLLMPLISFAQSESITVNDAQALLEEGAILVDVRENDEVAAMAYQSDGMLHIPLSELSDRYSELPNDKTLVMACRSGNRSQKAIDQLSELGVTNTINMEGGIKAWQENGFPVVNEASSSTAKSCCSKKSKEEKSNCNNKASKKDCAPKEGKSCCKKVN
ncbi:rhodanese-like domain-containing protein [Portibacter lacus]|uniref:Rhodanese domain-containing protein n=1 Tax=Portibacter lacus TaxID=1099794 RepID=A0AA37SQ78_9BACT|nr:rhodanese-like domain-containing protein [Portibacter lacus]GLR17677.1 hypothetical protein GCM10007940_22920 [Portibacter lacus]